MKDRNGEELKIGDFVESFSPRNFGEEGMRTEGIIVDLTPDRRLTDQAGVVFGGTTYPLLRSIGPKFLTKKLHSETRMKALEEAAAMYREMQDFAISA